MLELVIICGGNFINMKSFIKKSASLVLSLALITLLFTTDAFYSEDKSKTSAKQNIVVVLDPGHDTTHLGCH